MYNVALNFFSLHMCLTFHLDSTGLDHSELLSRLRLSLVDMGNYNPNSANRHCMSSRMENVEEVAIYAPGISRFIMLTSS